MIDSIVHKLREAGAFKGEIDACEAILIKAYSKRDPKKCLRDTLTLKPELVGPEKAIGLAISLFNS
ncbi:MAG: hypothetical protein QW222_03730 [Candidatus Bathyarchaeia archaeon]